MGRHRFRGDGSRPGSGAIGVASGQISPHRNPSRRSFSHSHLKQHQPPCKADILMEAGRLAAEYLVTKGLLPPDSLPGGGAHRELKSRSSMPAPERRTPALARLGNTAPDAGLGRRRFNDEWGSRKRSRYKGKMEHCDRRHGSDWGDWGRPRGRNAPWMDRARGYSDSADPEDDFAPGVCRGWQGGFGGAADELPSRSEVTGESGSERNREFTDDSRVLNSEAGEEVKSHASGKTTSLKESLVMLPGGAEDARVSEHDKDLLKLSSFVKVPTRPRSSVGHRSSRGGRGPKTEVNDTSEAAPAEAAKAAECSSSDSHANQTCSLKCQAPDDSSILSVHPMEESVNPQHESSQSALGMESSLTMIHAKEDDTFAQHADNREEIRSERKSSMSQENERSWSHNLKAPQSTSFGAVDQEQPAGDALFPKCESDSVVKMDEEKQLEPMPFKICSLNLMGNPEITEIPDDPVSDHQPSPLPAKNEKKRSVDFGLSTGNGTDIADDCSRLSGDDKVVPIIHVEDDSLVENNVCGSSKPKNEAMYSSLENVLSHAPHTDDLPGVQDGYSLEISEYLGGNISCCPSVQVDLNNPQTGMSLHSTEGFPGDDDPIYVSLGELPIGFMEVWDQSPQDYELF